MNIQNKFDSITIQPYSGDPLNRYLINSLGIQPYQISLLTFLAGFGMLSLWYWVMEYLKHPDIIFRGLYDYYSSSIGDALVVPLIIGIIFTSYQKQSTLFNQLSYNLQKYFWRFHCFA